MRAAKLFTYFLPFVANSLLRLVAIPVNTYVLGPREYGLFALMMGVVSICTVLATSVTGYVINHRVPPGEIAPYGLIATVALLEVLLGLILTAACMVLWPFFANWMGVAQDVSSLNFLILLLSVPLSAFWTSGSMVIVFDQRAGLYSAILIGQGVCQLLANIAALYIFHLRVGALVAGQVAGMTVCAVGGYIGLQRHLSLWLDRGVVRESISLMPWSMVSGLANSSTDLLERVVLGRVSSTYKLGLYVHSQSYRTMFGPAAKPFVQVLQPTMMKEARAERADFSETRDGWNIVYVMFSLFGMTFALVGREIVGALTHGKFTAAAIFVPFWCIFLTFQYLGRAQVAMLYAHGEGRKISAALIGSNMVSGILMLLLGIPWHAPGLVVAVLTGEMVNRALLQYCTRRRWSLPFQDFYALGGAACIVIAVAISYWLGPPLAVRVAFLAAIVLIAAIFVGPTARRFLLVK